MRGRVIAIVIALVILAFAGIRFEDHALTAHRHRHVASGQLTDAPAPEPGAAAVITRAASTSATVHTVLVALSRRQLSPALGVFLVSRHLPVAASRTGKPRSFPLLI